MKKINNKGVTLVELIVSFALVGVAIIYFFQTLYTVKKVYATARTETNEFINRDYVYRLLDAYFDKNSVFDIEGAKSKITNAGLDEIKYLRYINGMNQYSLKINGKYYNFFKYKNIMNNRSSSNIEEKDNKQCLKDCGFNTRYNSDMYASGNGSEPKINSITAQFKDLPKIKKMEIEYYNNDEGYPLNCEFIIKNGNEEVGHIDEFTMEHKKKSLFFNKKFNVFVLQHGNSSSYHTCYVNILLLELESN